MQLEHVKWIEGMGDAEQADLLPEAQAGFTQALLDAEITIRDLLNDPDPASVTLEYWYCWRVRQRLRRYLLFCTLVCRAGAGHGAGLRVRCLYGTDAHLSVQVCGRTRALQHPYHLHSVRALNKTSD